MTTHKVLLLHEAKNIMTWNSFIEFHYSMIVFLMFLKSTQINFRVSLRKGSYYVFGDDSEKEFTTFHSQVSLEYVTFKPFKSTGVCKGLVTLISFI